MEENNKLDEVLEKLNNLTNIVQELHEAYMKMAKLMYIVPMTKKETKKLIKEQQENMGLFQAVQREQGIFDPVEKIPTAEEIRQDVYGGILGDDVI